MTAENKGTMPGIKIQGLAILGLIVILLGVITPSLFRSTVPTPSNTPVTASTQSSGELSGIVIRMILFVAVASAVTIAITRITQERPSKIGNMAILGHVTVDRSIVYLVRAGNRKLLIGVDSTGVKALTELPVPVRLPDLVDSLPPEPVATASGAHVYGPIRVPAMPAQPAPQQSYAEPAPQRMQESYAEPAPQHMQQSYAVDDRTNEGPASDLGPLPASVPPDFAHELTALLIQRRTQ